MLVENSKFFDPFKCVLFVILVELFLKLLHSNYVSVIIVIKIFLIFVFENLKWKPPGPSRSVPNPFLTSYNLNKNEKVIL